MVKELQNCKIIRTESLDPLRIGKRIKKVVLPRESSTEQVEKKFPVLGKTQAFISKLCVPDSKILWLPFALAKAKKIIREESIQLIFTTSPPHSVHLLGAYLKKKTGIPWVADLRDQWADGLITNPSIGEKLNLILERKTLQHADHMITVSQPITDALHTNLQVDPAKVTTIPNGFDSEDFKKHQSKSSKKFILTYCGAITPDVHLESFFSGASKAVQTWPDLRQFLKIKLVGTITNRDINGCLQRLDISNLTDIAGYVTHSKSLDYLMASDLLILCLSMMKDSQVPGKTFEYLASGKPILAMLPEGAAKKYVLKFKRGIVVPPSDVDQIASVIYRSFVLWKRGDLELSVPRWKGLNEFDRRSQAGSVAELFDEISP